MNVERTVCSIVALVALTAVSAACSSSGGGGAGSCKTSSDCPRGRVCLKGVCEIFDCVKDSDCTGGVEEGTFCWAAEQICTAVECSGALSCIDGFECQDLLCEEKPIECYGDYECAQPAEKCYDGACVPRHYCEENKDCDNGFCVMEESRCEYYELKDTIEGQDTVDGGSNCTPPTTPPPQSSYFCKPCNPDDPCSCNPGICSSIAGGSYCSDTCTKDGECATGYVCEDKVCRPLGESCSGCVDPDETCESGKTCDFGSGKCVTQRDLCTSCTVDYQCGEDMRCVSTDGVTAVCMPQCSTTFVCPKGAKCQQRDDGAYYCMHLSTDCCYGSKCDTCTCEPPTPVCLGADCVECVQNSDCPINHPVCNEKLNRCELYCQPPTPVYWIDPDTQIEMCVQCLNSAKDCPAGYYCGVDPKIPQAFHKCYPM